MYYGGATHHSSTEHSTLFIFLPLPCLGLWGSLTCITYSSYKPFKSSTLTLLVSSSSFFIFYPLYFCNDWNLSHLTSLRSKRQLDALHSRHILTQQQQQQSSNETEGNIHGCWWMSLYRLVGCPVRLFCVIETNVFQVFPSFLRP